MWVSKIDPYSLIRPSRAVSGPEKGQDKKIRGRQVPCKNSCCALLLLTGSYTTIRVLRAGLATVIITANSTPDISCNAKMSTGLKTFLLSRTSTLQIWSDNSCLIARNTSQLISKPADRGQGNTDYTWVIFSMRNLLVRWQLEEVRSASSRCQSILMTPHEVTNWLLILQLL